MFGFVGISFGNFILLKVASNFFPVSFAGLSRPLSCPASIFQIVVATMGCYLVFAAMFGTPWFSGAATLMVSLQPWRVFANAMVATHDWYFVFAPMVFYAMFAPPFSKRNNKLNLRS